MARNISVKVPVATLVAEIENKIAEIDAAIANYPAALAQYEADKEAYKSKVAEFITDYVTKNVGLMGFDYENPIRINLHRGTIVELEFKTEEIVGFPQKPEKPEQPNQTKYYGRDYVTPKSLLEKNLRILRMTTQEEVNATTYGAILEIL
jgi:hypothetical protein